VLYPTTCCHCFHQMLIYAPPLILFLVGIKRQGHAFVWNISIIELYLAGISQDGIPPINNSSIVTVEEADEWLSEEEPVLVSYLPIRKAGKWTGLYSCTRRGGRRHFSAVMMASIWPAAVSRLSFTTT